METLITIKPDFACVFLLNGAFAEHADGFAYGANDPLYITALPLSAHLLPYTVKIAGSRPLCNEKLCAAFTADNRLLIKLFPRYNYIYSPSKQDGAVCAGITSAERLFSAVKQKNFNAAKKYLSEGLSATIDNAGLEAFFNDYTAIVKDDFSKGSGNFTENSGYYLINADGKGTLFRFETAEGLIDNITSED